MDDCTLAAGPLTAVVKAAGAELVSLKHDRLGEVMWGGEPPWERHSPVLFPIVGRLAGDGLRVGGRTYPMSQHGFARDRTFAWTAREASSCLLTLEDDAATRASFPFPFRLELGYALRDGALHVGYRIANPGDAPLPCSLGAHPAFRWPLADGVAQDACRIVFADREPEPVRRLDGGLLKPTGEPTPVVGRVLALDPALFDADALILDRPRSRSLRYEAGGSAALEIGWTGFEQLGLWSKRPGAFLCIEPWRGHADAVGFAGEFADKPGVMSIPPGGAAELGWSVRPVES